MTPDEQIAVIAARRDGKPVRWRIKGIVCARRGNRCNRWYEMDLTEDFDFRRYRAYKIAPTEPRKPAELWMHKNYAGDAEANISFHVFRNNCFGPDGTCFREVVEADKEADERAAIVVLRLAARVTT